MKAAKFYAAPSDTQGSLLLSSSGRLLGQLSNLITELDKTQYGASCDNKNPSIGKHVRHIVEFYSEFFDYLESDSSVPLCYDKRQRDLNIETSRDRALQQLSVIANQINTVPSEHQDLILASIINPQQPMNLTSSSIHRELTYLFDHTVHHMALIKIFAERVGVRLEHEFGVAPSTLAYEASQQS